MQQIASQILTTIEYAHGLGIVHRDLTMSSVFIDPETTKVTVGSWSQAEMFHADHKMQYPATVPSYKAPEVLLRCKCYDLTADSWSFGVIFGSLVRQQRESQRRLMRSEDVRVSGYSDWE